MIALGQTVGAVLAAFPIIRVQAVTHGLALSLILLSAGAALAAPNGATLYDCLAAAQSQYQLDLSLCLGYLAPQRDVCKFEASQRYANAMTSCAVSASKSASVRAQVSPGLKQNSETAFMRRLRF